VGPVKKKSPNFQNHKIGKKIKKKLENTLVIIGLKEGPLGALTRL
jgi:hypothetical protein